jgi:hypothetical protein
MSTQESNSDQPADHFADEGAGGFPKPSQEDASNNEDSASNEDSDFKQGPGEDKDNVDISIEDMMSAVFCTEVPINDRVAAQELAFNIKAFKYDKDNDFFPDGPKSSKQLSDAGYVNNCKVLLATGDELKLMKKNRSNYARITKMGIRTINLPKGGTYQALYRKSLPEGKGDIILPMRRMFPAIYAAHQHVGHMKIVSSYKNLSKIVYNHTREQSKIFIETCPACIERAPVIKPLKGASCSCYQIGEIPWKNAS